MSAADQFHHRREGFLRVGRGDLFERLDNVVIEVECVGGQRGMIARVDYLFPCGFALADDGVSGCDGSDDDESLKKGESRDEDIDQRAADDLAK